MNKIITTFFDKNLKSANAIRKVLKNGTRMHGIIKETLSNTAFFSKGLNEAIQETEEEKISDDEKSDEGN